MTTKEPLSTSTPKEEVSKVNSALKKIGKKAVSNGVYKRGGKASSAFKAYEKIRGGKKAGKDDSFWKDAGIIQKVKDATARIWGKNIKPGSHGTGQAVDIVGIPLDRKTQKGIKKLVDQIKSKHSQFANFKIYVKRESDHYHIGIKPG